MVCDECAARYFPVFHAVLAAAIGNAMVWEAYVAAITGPVRIPSDDDGEDD